MKMSGLFTKMRRLPLHYPLIRGMISYSIIWPTCSLVQEYLEHGTSLEEANYARAARFGIFGSFFMAPVFYGWMKFSGRFFKRNNLRTAIFRAAIEQVTYSPLAMAYFFFGMSLLEMKPARVCWNEVREKFWPTYKIGMVFWPTAQTINYSLISEKNKIVFVSAASFIWTVYLAHMKGKEEKSVLGLDNPLTDRLVNTSVVGDSNSLPEGDKIRFQEPLLGVADKAGKINPNIESSLGTKQRNVVVPNSDPERSSKLFVQKDAKHPNPIPKLFHETVENDLNADKVDIRNPIRVIIDNSTLPTVIENPSEVESSTDKVPVTPVSIVQPNPISINMIRGPLDQTSPVIIGTEIRTVSAPVVLARKEDDSDDNDNNSKDERNADTGTKDIPDSSNKTVILSDTGVVELPLGEEERLRIMEVVGAASIDGENADQTTANLDEN